MKENGLSHYFYKLRGLTKRLHLRSFLKEDVGLIYTALGNVGSSLLGGLFWFLLASLLEVESYGLVNYYIALASIFAAVAFLGLDATVITYLAKGEKRIFNEAVSLTLISGLGIAAVLSVFQWSSGLLAVAMVFFGMTLAEMLGRKMYRKYALLSIGQRLAQIFLSTILYFQLGILGIILGYFLGNLVFSYRYLGSIRKFTTKFECIKERRNFAVNSYGFNIIRNFTNYMDKIVIAPLFGYYVLGLYQLGFQFFLFLSIIPLSLYYYLLPEESSGNNKRSVKILGLALAVVAAVASFVAVPYIIERLFPAFIESTQIVRIMCLAVVPATIVAIYNASLLGKCKSKIVLSAGLLYFCSLIVGVAVLGQTMGALGLSITLISAQSIQAAYLFIITRKQTKKEVATATCVNLVA